MTWSSWGPSNLFAGQPQTDERILRCYGDFDGFDFTGKVVLTARGNGVYFTAKHQNAETAGLCGLLSFTTT